VYVFQVASFHQISQPKPCLHLSSLSLIRVTFPAHLILLGLVIRISFDEYHR
jgi:hypothetical protein